MTVAYLDPRTGATFPIGTPIRCGPDHRPLLLTGSGLKATPRTAELLGITL